MNIALVDQFDSENQSGGSLSRSGGGPERSQFELRAVPSPPPLDSTLNHDSQSLLSLYQSPPPHWLPSPSHGQPHLVSVELAHLVG